jgi:WD40 repeat protein
MTFEEMLAGESEATISLAESVSLAVLIEPVLLRRARLDLERSADPGVEGDVWFSSFVASRDPDGIVFHRVAAEGLRQRLAASVERRRAAWKLLQQIHATTSPALQLEEEIAWLLADESDRALPTIQERLRRAIASLVGGERVGLAHWAVQAIHRLPEAVLALDETRILYTAARLRLGQSSTDEDVPDWMSWVLPGSHRAQAIVRLRLFDGVLELEPVVASDYSADPADDVVRVPAVDPLTVEIDAGDAPMTVTIAPGRPTYARIGSGSVRLRTSDGAVFELTPSDDLERRRQREIVRFDSLFAELEGFTELRGPLQMLRTATFRGGVGLTVTGPPGSGKTGLLVAFARSLTRPHAAHFFSDRTHQWRDADLAWASLAAQVERLSPPDAAPPSRPVERLRRALHRLPATDQVFVLILDGLDELSPVSRAADDLDALFGGGLPPHACVIGACDSDSALERRLRGLLGGSSSLAGINIDHEQWRQARIESAIAIGISERMAYAIDGNLLAAHLVSKVPSLTPEAFNGRASVGAVLATAWRLLPQAAQTVLGLLAAARDPLTQPRVEEALRVSGPSAESPFQAIEPWLAVGRTPDAENTYVMRHRALRTFVEQESRSSVEGGLQAWHAALLGTVADWTPRDRGEFQKEYSLRYALAHAVGAGDADRFVALATNPAFLEARCRLDSPDRLLAELRTLADGTEPSPLVRAVADALSDFIQPVRHDPRAVRFVVDMALRQEGREAGRSRPSLRLRHPVAAPRAAFTEHRGAVLGCARFGGDRIVTWSADGTLKMWQRADLSLERTLTGHTGDVTTCHASDEGPSLVPGGLTLASGSRDGTVRIWPTDTSTVVTTHAAPVRGLSWTYQGLISWDAAGVIRVSEARTGEVQSVHQHHGAVTACVLSGAHLWSGGEDHTIRVWTDLVNAGFYDLKTSPALHESEGDSAVIGLVDGVLRERLLAGAREIVFDAREYRQRGVAARLKVIANLDLAERREPQQGWVRVAIGPTVHVLKVETLPGAGGESVRLTAAEQRASSTLLAGHTGAVTALVGTPGELMFSCSEDGTIRAWNSRKLAEAGALRGHESAVLGCEIVADATLLSWSRDRTLRVWDLRSERELLVLSGHRGAVLGARVLSSIGQILSWSSDGTLRLWDSRSGRPLAVFEGHTAAVTGAIVLDQAYILSCAEDRTLIYWDPPIWQ